MQSEQLTGNLYFLREIKNQLIFLAIIFILSLWCGYYYGQTHAAESNLFIEKLSKEMDVKNSTFFSIFSNNARLAFVVVLFGTFFGIVPIISIISNGVTIGIVSSVFASRHGMGFLFVGMTPHGIIEIPAFLIAGACGLYLGREFYRFLFYGNPFEPSFFWIMGKMVTIVVPLFLLASFIETFITTALLQAFLK